jgi:hypothetical protein
MTRSIFDPGGGETERSGSTHTGPDAANLSHLPPDVIDGEVEEVDDNLTPIGVDADEVAQRLREMSAGGATGDDIDQAFGDGTDDAVGDAIGDAADEAASGGMADPLGDRGAPAS